ncbi:DUF4189 domain-containing protein [Neisseria sp. Ec49-e6-T10]|uniref:DUF4189 domain-containing protein n=1 Tax=Neisseria sp. Ec49-e6-T10 TaxID=3140744 RepID=UPI003EB83925
MKKLLLLLVLCSGLVYGQSPYSYGGESEQDRIAREHQPGGIYDSSKPSSSGKGGYRVPTVWGAIAIDYKKFQGWGSSNSEESLNSAKNEALKLCKKRSNTCKVVITYNWNNCGAVAASDSTAIWMAETMQLRADANEAALKSCNEKMKKQGKTPDCSLWVPAKCALFGGS